MNPIRAIPPRDSPRKVLLDYNLMKFNIGKFLRTKSGPDPSNSLKRDPTRPGQLTIIVYVIIQLSIIHTTQVHTTQFAINDTN